jgi:integrase
MRGACATGMGPKEYWGSWELHPDHVHIHGTKRASRVRNVPRWTRVTPPTTTRGVLEDAWESAIGAALGIHDLRRSFALWMEEMGLSLSRQRLYLGHSARNTTEMYTPAGPDGVAGRRREETGSGRGGRTGGVGGDLPDFAPDMP